MLNNRAFGRVRYQCLLMDQNVTVFEFGELAWSHLQLVGA